VVSVMDTRLEEAASHRLECRTPRLVGRDPTELFAELLCSSKQVSKRVSHLARAFGMTE